MSGTIHRYIVVDSPDPEDWDNADDYTNSEEASMAARQEGRVCIELTYEYTDSEVIVDYRDFVKGSPLLRSDLEHLKVGAVVFAGDEQTEVTSIEIEDGDTYHIVLDNGIELWMSKDASPDLMLHGVDCGETFTLFESIREVS